MKWFLGVYTGRFNRRYKLTGHLFSGRYKALLVDGSGNGYLRTVCDYVHLNPVRAHLVSPEQKLETYLWSSYGHYLGHPSQRPAWLRVDRLFGESGIPKDSEAGREQFAAQMEFRRQDESDSQFKGVRRGWCFGSEQFRRELLEQVSDKRGAWHIGPELRESSEARAERLISAELSREGWNEQDLLIRAKGDLVKVNLAAKLRAETTVTIVWIAERLNMGSRGHLTHLLYWRGKSDDQRQTLGL
jgi:hypothetical protein